MHSQHDLPWHEVAARLLHTHGKAEDYMSTLSVAVRTSRTRLLSCFAAAMVVSLVAGDSVNQAWAQGFGRGRSNLTGTYRLNTASATTRRNSPTR
jgi:hypothetical protein